MSDEQSCHLCGAGVTNTAVTGILCEGCYEEQSAGAKKLTNAPINAGLIALAVSMIFSFHINGFDFVMVGAGGVALIAGARGALQASSKKASKVLMIGVVVALVGALQAFRGAAPALF